MDDKTKQKIRELIASASMKLNEVSKDVVLARKAGINVTALEQRERDLKVKIAQLKAVYG